MSQHVLGIDLGTLNSCVAVVQDGRPVVLSEGGRTTVPSVVAFAGQEELVGESALRRAVTDPKNTLVATKRLLGHPHDSREIREAQKRMAYTIRPSPVGSVLLETESHELTPVQVAARVLHRLREIADRALGESTTRAVISVPAHFNEIQRRATKLAAEYAGLEVLRLINEPTAAAFAYGYRRGENFTLAVYDLGGGTFDVTLMRATGDRFEVIATDGDTYLGGEDFDTAIAEWLASECQAEHGGNLQPDESTWIQLWEAATQAKLDLTELEETTIELPYLFKGKDGGFLPFECTLSRQKLVDLTLPLIQCTLDLCRRCTDVAEVDIDQLDAVLLVGGQTRMPAVRDAVRDFFGQEPRRDINPDEVVAMGAALYAYSIDSGRLRADSEEAAEEALEVAVKQTARARKVMEAVEALRETPPEDERVETALSRVMAELEIDADLSTMRADEDRDLPAAVEQVREEMLELQRKVEQVVEESEESAVPHEQSKPLVEAASVVSDWLTRAEKASQDAEARHDDAERHASARKVELSDVTSHAMGIATAGDLYSILIEKNDRVPAEKRRVFTTHEDDQEEVHIRVYQGEEERASDNDLLGDFVLTGIEPAARLTPKIEVSFRLDEDGILSVRAHDQKTRAEQRLTVTEPMALRRSPEGS
ncbi:MAG: Hsp70 family protein [Myxococcota bacterium]